MSQIVLIHTCVGGRAQGVRSRERHFLILYLLFCEQEAGRAEDEGEDLCDLLSNYAA